MKKSLILLSLTALSLPCFGAVQLKDEGVSKGYIQIIDCAGDGVECSRSGMTGKIDLSPADSVYLKLDASNDPITGSLRIGGDGANYAEFKTDGELNLHGTARVKVNLWTDAAGLRSPGEHSATFVQHGLTGVWQFDDAGENNEESISGTVKIPSDMDRTVAPTFKIGWSADGVSPGNCVWQLEYLWITPGEDTTAAAQETLTVTSAASSTSNGLVISEFTGIDLPSSSDVAMFFRITRLSADANDTISDTVELRGRLFSYTANKLGESL